MLLFPGIIHWHAEHVQWAVATSKLGQLANKEWSHSHLRLNLGGADGQDPEEDRKDAVAALWRAVERRLQLFDEVYAIRAALGIGRRERINLKHLQELGLIRGSVLDDIRRLRNAIQHKSEMPPERNQCLLYQDAIWYFLRSTELYARRIPTGYELIENQESYAKGKINERIEVSMRPPEWNVEVYCEHLSPDHYTLNSREAWIEVELFNNRINIDPEGIAFAWGTITDPAWILEFVKLYFSLT